MNNKFKSISVFFPCFNDEKTIGKLVETSFSILKNIAQDFEVIVVDDGSTDHSRKVLMMLAKKHPHLKLIFHPKNIGYGGALKSGFKNSTKELIFYTDGDGQYNVEELPLLTAIMTDEISFINGIKMARKDNTYRIVLGNLYSFIARWIFSLPIFDVDCDFRLIRRDIIQKIHLTSDSGSICVELVKKSQRAGAKFREVSVTHLERKYGQSQFFKPGKLLSTFMELFTLWFDLMLFNRDQY